MKRLSILLTIFLAIAVSSEAFAQQLSVKAGLNFAKFSDDDLDMKLGFNVGAGVELPIGEMFAVEPGLLLSTKGYKFSYTIFGSTQDAKCNLLYLEIPINAKAYFDLGGIKIFGQVGPYLACGLTGKMKYEDSDDVDIEWGGDDGEMKRFDFGLNLGAGVDLGVIQAGLQYGLGFVDLGSDLQHRVLSINAAYKF